MDSAKPSFDLVRALTDEHVLRALMRHRRLTRAELAAETGISKPTAGESVRRLTERGLVADTGERTPGGRGRGRVGTYYSLSAEVGTALAISIGPAGVTALCLDAYGEVVHRAEREVGRPARPARVAAALREVAVEAGRAGNPAANAAGSPGGSAAAGRAGRATTARAASAGEDRRPGKPRIAVVSAADPVDRDSGRLVQLPDSPFLVGELDPVKVLAPHVDGPIVVDNDVNWAARAERRHAGGEFAYLFLGEGLGCAIVGDNEIRRGGAGLAGEIAHVITVGPGGRAVPFIEIFAELDLRRAGSTAIDVDHLKTHKSEMSEPLANAIAGVIAATIALADPARIVIGGSWGPELLPEIQEAVDRLPRRLPVWAATITTEPSLTGAREYATDRLQSAIVG
ncbi:ROK family protein [Actinoplanes sp. CA-030573]|uniref:ROK family protein n=1 Tax=Actinoplanes sp. CA-030573 TaxID=3239898 RepID=UPI003D8D8CFA